MRRVWMLMLITALAGAGSSWLWLSPSAAAGVSLVAAFVAFVSLQEMRRP